MRFWISLALSAAALRAGPVEFGMAELNAAIDARNFKYKPRIMAELNIEAPETFRIEPYAAGGGHITGGDLRGLMYGLLEAAGQMRSTGHLKLTHGIPALSLRGVRITAQPDAAWFGSGDFWQGYFAAMARARFNRLEIDFDAAPPSTAVLNLRNATQIAHQYGVDVAIGFTAPGGRAVSELLRLCPVVRTIVLQGDPPADPAELLDALHDAGRRVVLELPEGDRSAPMIDAAGQSGVPWRMFSQYMGESFNPSPPDAYWDMDASQGADSVNAISGAGFEVRVPLASAPNEPGTSEPSLDAVAPWGLAGYARPVPKPSN